MTASVPNQGPFRTIETVAIDLLMSQTELLERVSLLDTGGEFGPVQRTRWIMAAADGGWTPVELLAAVRWLNVHHDGFVKIAHVHKRIERERELLHAAEVLCYEHPVVIKALGYDSPQAARDDRSRDIIGWKATKGAAAWSMLTRAEWIAWMETDRSVREQALRLAFAQ